MRSLVFGCGLALALCAPAAAVASAPSGPVVGLRVAGPPAPYFVFSATPGQTVTRTVTVVNAGRRAATVRLYPTDATTGPTSGAVYGSPSASRGVGTWIHLSTKQLTLGAHERRNVSFTVDVPTGTSDGQHLGGIIARPEQPRSRLHTRRGAASFGIIVREQAVIAVEANLPGPRVKQLAITGLRPGAQSGRQTLLVGLASTGNALTKGQATLDVFDKDGGQRVHRRFALDTFVPHTQIEYPVLVRNRARLQPGHYRARITAAWGGHRVTTRWLGFTVTENNQKQVYGSGGPGGHDNGGGGGSGSRLPWIIAGGLALIVVLGLGYGLGRRKREPALPSAGQ